jgi:hypothetical protein
MKNSVIKRARRTSEEAAIDEQLKKERERLDLDALLPIYERATGFCLSVEEEAEDPDFICARSDGLIVGLELTAIWNGPEFSLFRTVLPEVSAWDANDDCDLMWERIEQKSTKVGNYRTKYNGLILQAVEGEFRTLMCLASEIPIGDFASMGFDEIWLADYTGLRSGAHREVPIFGLYPDRLRNFTDRSDYDRKPYR